MTKYDLEVKDIDEIMLQREINAAWNVLACLNGDMAQFSVEQDIGRMEDELDELTRKRNESG